MTRPAITAFTIPTVTLIRYKRLRNGEMAVRNIRNVTTSTTSIIPAQNGKSEVVVVIDAPEVTGRLVGEMQHGSISLSPVDIKLKGYLKGRNFKVHGYHMSASCTTCNTRRRA